jgi:hypothetical protein
METCPKESKIQIRARGTWGNWRALAWRTDRPFDEGFSDRTPLGVLCRQPPETIWTFSQRRTSAKGLGRGRAPCDVGAAGFGASSAGADQGVRVVSLAGLISLTMRLAELLHILPPLLRFVETVAAGNSFRPAANPLGGQGGIVSQF